MDIWQVTFRPLTNRRANSLVIRLECLSSRFSIEPSLPNRTGPWLRGGYLFDSEGLGGLLCLNREKRSIFGKLGEKSPSGKERQTFRPGSMLTSEGKKKR
jgi:hypothetical protein